MRALVASILASVTIGVGAAAGQTVAPLGMVENPCVAPVPIPPRLGEMMSRMLEPAQPLDPAFPAALAASPEMVEYQKQDAERAKRDWPNLCRYAEDDAMVRASARPIDVVFLGDSITEIWSSADPRFFSNGIVNRGIGGQTSSQMLLRFHADVVSLKPKIVHILAGTNDIAGNTGPTSVQNYENNITAMVEMARANGIRVVIGSIPPAAAFAWRPSVQPRPRIAELNAWLARFARQNRITFIDYHAVLTEPDGSMLSKLTNDGVHPNRDGYARMKPILLQALTTLHRSQHTERPRHHARRP
ncbi:SGNH/GDSL hydrolase family protein [Phenylobacterium montanum]|uniref:SGNH/GDSL hydrolase family protein n=1 Tax=Phenylobacterium montanum TaxID=2823693 RepID=A0A975IWM7_9CAUL|nr:SGNH/GDSL hydrolase family protein [Caulobacter sp. S6]QUD90242.1 SGNH/GDSL hydrolase family protein [Caulobacter sp. S6]